MGSELIIRLDRETRQRIERLARQKGISTSEVIRRAVKAWADREQPVTSPYEAMRDLIGVVHGGDPGRSENAGRLFAALLKSGKLL